MVEKWPMLVHLFIVGSTVHEEFQCSLDSDKWVWLLPKVKKKCGEVKVLEISDLQDPDA